MLGGLLGAIGPRFAGFMASSLSGYLMIGALVVCGILYGLWRMEAGNVRDAHEQIGLLQANETRFKAALTSANHTIHTLSDAAEQNRQAAIRAVLRAEIAEDAMRIVRDQAARDTEVIRRDAEAIRQRDAGDCRRLTDPLPADFIGWVFDAPADRL